MKYALVLDCETSGICFGTTNPAHNPETGERYQIVSIGMIVVEVATFTPVRELYLEVQWDGKSGWSSKAEAVHGLSKQYLEENGVTPEEAVTEILEILLDYWGPTGTISLAGHNVASFDLFFLDQLLRDFDVSVTFGSRHVDTYSIGITVYGAYDSNELFELVGVNRDLHNALEDARACVKVLQTTREFAEAMLGGGE